MRKLWRSRKALSPVIAAIILIAVTVAVSIAVAAWMGALSFTFMATEQVSFTGIAWTEDVNGTITQCNLEAKNSGTSILTIETVKVNNVEVTPVTGWTITAPADETLDPNDEVTLNISHPGTGYVRGGNYAFTVVTAKNNAFGPYTATAPS